MSIRCLSSLPARYLRSTKAQALHQAPFAFPTPTPTPQRSSLLASSSSPLLISRMSTTEAAPLNEYLILLPDHTSDPSSTFQNRLRVRPRHFTDLGPDHSSGKIPLGGALLSEHPTPEDVAAGRPPKMIGSVMIVTARSQEEAMERIRGDVYAREGVWDLENAKVWPVGSQFSVLRFSLLLCTSCSSSLQSDVSAGVAFLYVFIRDRGLCRLLS